MNGTKLAVLKNIHVVKLEQGESYECAFLANVILGYGYIGLYVVSASVHVMATIICDTLVMEAHLLPVALC